MKPVNTTRCAIYTRKSSEEGLEQGFNSLDAQYEACAAYVLSQAQEGWVTLPDRYDDGGLSGGTLERPALQRLLGDIAAGRIDTVVVYKVDRLSRSLLDFARLVEAFERAGTTFISITQAFNTTSSMGRLTLNMLLSFAQFEREVTAERIRDKIAASKARGMWMGGVPPLGYQPAGRSLAIVEDHASLTRHIFGRYLALGTVRRLADELAQQGRLSPERATTSGRTIGGRAFTRGQLYLMLKCRTYLGEIQHKDQVYPGLHPALIARDTWEQAQALLAANLQGSRTRTRASRPSLLAGRIVDEAGEPLVAAHASKAQRGGGTVRYAYYVSRKLHHGDSDSGTRLPAREVEAVVAARLADALADPLALINDAGLVLAPDGYASIVTQAEQLVLRLRRREHDLTGQLVTQVRVLADRIEIACDARQLAVLLGAEHGEAATHVLTAVARLTRSGRAMRLIQGGRTSSTTPDPSLLQLLAQARRIWLELRRGEVDITRLAARERVSASWLTRVLRLAFLPPKLTEAILAGTQPAELTASSLMRTDAVQVRWARPGATSGTSAGLSCRGPSDLLVDLARDT